MKVLTATEDAVYDAILDTYEAHLEKIDYSADRWLPLYECSCGFKSDANLPGSLKGDILFQHISAAIADAGIEAMRKADHGRS